MGGKVGDVSLGDDYGRRSWGVVIIVWANLRMVWRIWSRPWILVGEMCWRRWSWERGFKGEDMFGRFAVIKFDEEGGEAFDEGGSGGEAEVAAGVDERTREPYWREASVNLVGGNFLGRGDLWPALAVGDDGGEAFVIILDGRKAGSEGELFSGERHEER